MSNVFSVTFNHMLVHLHLQSIDSKGAVTTAIDENKLLLLPRVSSPLFFDTICPFGPHAR